MIKSKLKIFLLVWPIILLLGIWGNYSYQRHEIDGKLLEADGIVWQAEEKQFTVQINEREDGELLHMAIMVIGPENTEVFNANEVIDRDMFGGGFVRAVQVDQDSENEIVVWHAQAKYYLDFSEGLVRVVPFDQAPQRIKNLAESWHKYNVMAGLEMTILLLFVFSYYIVCLLGMGLLRVLKRKNNVNR